MMRNGKTHSGGLDKERQIFTKAFVCAVFVVVSVMVFLQVGSHEFINYDDPEYVYLNQIVQQGLTLSTISWAFTSTSVANWHPLTWLSHMLDIQLFGLNPAGHHYVNVVLHTVNAMLLFLLFNRLTGALWRSAVLAAFFLLHPLHVESVAWVAERKDLLSVMFGIVCLYLYAGYVERPSPIRLLSVLLTLILSLMAKPMLVSLPLVMLLADYWPMRRFASDHGASGHFACEKTFLMLVREKIPLFLIVAASCTITIYAQHKGDAIRSLEASPFTLRVANAIVSYKDYLVKTFWPLDLAVLYPYPESLPAWNVLGSAGLLTAITIIVIRERRQYPCLLVGWLWYVGTLVPVIGIVRVGLQGMADRYTYLPLIGIFLMVVWGVADLTVGWAYRRTLLVSVAVVSLCLSALLSWRQASWWKDNVTLYKYTLAVTSNNYIIQNNLGSALDAEGKIDEAITHYSEAVRIAPRYAKARLNMAITLRKAGRLEESLVHAAEAIKLGPDYAPAYNELGAILLMMGRFDEATANLGTALTINPELADAHYNLGLTLSNRGRSAEAVVQYAEALRIKPNDVDCLYNLGIEYARMGKYGEAAEYFRKVLLLKPDKEMELLARNGLARIEK